MPAYAYSVLLNSDTGEGPEIQYSNFVVLDNLHLDGMVI